MNVKDRQIDAEIKKGIDARTKEFKEKITKLAYAQIKKQLVPSAEPLKGYPHNESIDEARKMPKNPAIDNDPKVKDARKDHAAGIWDGNVDKEGEAIVFVKGKPYTVTNKYESIEESVGKAVNGLNDLGNKMKGRDQKDIRRIEKLYRSGNNKVFQGAIRALDTDLRDQVKDIFDALGMVKQGVIESVDLTEGKMKDFHDMVKKGMTAKQIAKKIGLPEKDVAEFMKGMNESVVIVDEQILEAVTAGKGKETIDIDYIGDKKLTAKIEKKYKVKVKVTGNTMADVSGAKKDIVTFLSQMHMLDDSDIKDLYPELLEGKQMSKVSDMTERAMTLPQIANKYKADIAKAQKSGSTASLKKAEKELIAWAMANNEIGNAKEAGDWLDNVVADKDQFAALLKFNS